MEKKLILIAVLMNLTAFCSGEIIKPPVKPLEITIDQAVEMALERNSDIIIARKNVQIFEAKVNEYIGTLLPAISLTATYTRNMQKPAFYIGGNLITIGATNAYNAGAQANQILWAGGKVRTGLKMAEILSDNTKEQLTNIRRSISKTVKTLCYDIMLASATIKIEEEHLDIAKQHLTEVKDRYKQGLSSDLEVFRQEVEVLNAEPALIKARNIYELGILNLKNILGKDAEEPVVLIGTYKIPSQVTTPVDELYRTALENRSDIIMANQMLENAKQNVKLQKADFYPSFYAFANRQMMGMSDNTFYPGDSKSRVWSTAAGVNMQMSIFSGGSTMARITQARFAEQQAVETLNETKRNAKIEVKKSWLNIAESTERAKAEEGATAQARKALKATEIRFKNGLSSHLELHDATLSLNKNQLAHVLALHDTFVSMNELQWAIGQ